MARVDGVNFLDRVWTTLWRITVQIAIAVAVPERGPTTQRSYVFAPHRSLYTAALEEVARSVPTRETRVLDLAAGTGYGTELLIAGACNTVGVESSGKAIRKALRSPRLPLVRANAESLPFCDASFDAVVSIETIEHLRRPTTFLTEVSRVLRSPGLLVLTTPLYAPDAPYHSKYHLNEWTLNGIEQLVNTCGLTTTNVKTISSQPGGKDGKTVLRSIANRAERLSLPAPLPPDDSIILTATKLGYIRSDTSAFSRSPDTSRAA